MIKFPTEFPTNIRHTLVGFFALNLEAYFLAFIIAELTNLTFVKDVGLIPLFTLILLDLCYGWLVMLVIGLFIWRGQILNKTGRIILVGYLGYAGLLLFINAIVIIHWDRYPYEPKVQAGGSNPPKNFTLVYTDLRRKTEEKPMGDLEQKREQAWP